MKLSFIIPALNEINHLPRTLDAIHKTMGDNTEYEVILSDNGSTDGTPEFAERAGCHVISDPLATISRLRNLAANSASGELLVFIDSDVSLAPEWLSNLKSISSEDSFFTSITGSKCLPPPNSSSFIIKNWFSLLPTSSHNYINSGHLIVPKSLHEKIGGFCENLRTGEDYEYCQRAKKKGLKIQVRPELKAYHYGFPSRLYDFVEREAWHGRSDVESLGAFLSSRTAQVAVANTTLLLLTPISAIISETLWLPAVFLSVWAGGTLVMTHIKFQNLPLLQTVRTAACFQAYLCGRTAALWRAHQRPKARR
ncbi:hypothetical protein BTO32_03045 [Marinobacter lutaoensis]|uniref:Glycosyltransferase 2-like domain-containing protein n=1 Tax=Marinobacter lutaoensis TaxID=135739 RepID=A0A1V2DXE5_9GAMM|nr:glycosyltransferase [Marinobacter lutaoensis]ONF45445.1 hypothetical protein BTO32_03045 [Marinobacter lutaoensis]